MVDDSIKIQRLPFPVAGISRIKELKERRKGKEKDGFNEYVKDTMEKEKEKNRPSLNSDEKEHSKDVENSNPTGSEDSSKIDITV